MADRTIKPDSGNDLVLQNNGGGTKIEIPNSGDIEINGTIGSGTFNGTLGGTALYPSGFIRQTVVNQGDGQKSATSSAASAVISQAITSGSQNSKILITFSGRAYTASASTELIIKFGTSNLASDIDTQFSLWDNNGAIAERICCQVLYDIPQSTTNTIYVSIQSSNTNLVYINVNGSLDGNHVLTLQEIID